MALKKLNDIEIKEALLETLVYFDQICRKYNLKYTLHAGSLLGAIRHKGFIPWDDDIDVAMPYVDYKKLISLGDEINKNGRFILHGYSEEKNNEENYIYPYLKLEDNTTVANFKFMKDSGGSWVDIFPINSVPVNQNKYIKYLKKVDLNLRLLFAGNRIKNQDSKLHKIFRSILYANRNSLRNNLVNKIEKLNTLNTDVVSDTIGFSIGANYDKAAKKVFPRNWFNHYVDADFEGHKFKVIKNYDKYLTIEYGDWRKLPPVEERINKHGFDLYKKTVN